MTADLYVQCHRTRTKLRKLIDAANELVAAVERDDSRFPVSPLRKRRLARNYKTALAAYRGAE